MIKSIQAFMNEAYTYMRYAVVGLFVLAIIAMLINYTMKFLARRKVFKRIKESGLTGLDLNILVGLKCYASSEIQETGTIKLGTNSFNVSSSDGKLIENGSKVIILKIDSEKGILVKKKIKHNLKAYNKIK